MSMIWAGAVEIALAWAVILSVKIASNAFEWKFEHLLPNYWYPVVKRKLAKPETVYQPIYGASSEPSSR